VKGLISGRLLFLNNNYNGLNGNNNLNNNGRFVGIVKQNCWDFIIILTFQSSIFLRRMTRFIKIIVHPSSSFARCDGTEKLKEPMLSRNKTLRQFAEFLRKVLRITKTHALKSAQSLVITNK